MEQKDEVWKQVEGYDRYFVSNLGRVKSIDALVNTSRGIRTYKGKVLTPHLHRLGYLYLHISQNAVTTTYSVHRLVAKAFIENQENKREVNHKDGIKTNNYIENLEWRTHRENIQHAWDTGLSKFSQKRLDAAKLAKYKSAVPIAQLNKEGKLLRIFRSIRHAERYLGTTRITIRKVRRFSHFGHIFQKVSDYIKT